MLPMECRRLAEVDLPIAGCLDIPREKIRYVTDIRTTSWVRASPLGLSRSDLLSLLLRVPAIPSCSGKPLTR